MKISILCSDATHPVNAYLNQWISSHAMHEVALMRRRDELDSGDLLFLISCSEIIDREVRDRFKKVLVIHASDLPLGRGWSPHVWQIVEGSENVCVTLLEAEDHIDSGDIWNKIWVAIPVDALWTEINDIIFEAECSLMDYAVENFHSIKPTQQNRSIPPTYYPKRTPADSELDPQKSIADQFDLIRVCDPDRFPAYFSLRGSEYIIRLERK
ncbi:formyltransferase family protein [Coraliomargarita algicola]|uniref:Formyltransferase family protein n=1 Tax=Coraliomargarita algicola TaxID=3092156 RepID=A0ABZ0RQS2_9BACT|nr:formyltransferase family protein [Coraliomargarita sp. J2-16]WPJ97330.1 formyltransferase family protein [Coraliomargarita sp. J2-16]